MSLLKAKDLPRAKKAFHECREALSHGGNCDDIPRETLFLAVRYSCELLAREIPGNAVELRVPPFCAVNICEGIHPDPHNLTPPEVIEISPELWLRLAGGILSWDSVIRREALNDVDDIPAARSLPPRHQSEISAALPLTE